MAFMAAVELNEKEHPRSMCASIRSSIPKDGTGELGALGAVRSSCIIHPIQGEEEVHHESESIC